MTSRAATIVGELGAFSALVGDTGRALTRRPFQRREFLEQAAFIISVSIVPVVLVTIPFTVLVVFFINQLLAEIGAADLSGAGTGLAVIRELGPFAAVLVISGAGATAICSDLGARTIREEIDAMRVLGIDPVHRLVVPRVLAFGVVSLGLNALVSVVGIMGGYVFTVIIEGGSPGLFVSSLTLLTGGADFLASEIKALLFGVTAGLVACHLGLNAKGGPKGVGEAVNQTVVFTLMILTVINSTVTAVYLQLTG